MQEIQSAIIFYLVFFVFGIIGFAFLYSSIKRHKMLLYLISKPVGLAIVGLPIWLLSSFKVIKFNNDLIIQFIFFVFFVGALGVLTWKAYRKFQSDDKFFRNNRKFLILVLVTELLSILLYGGYLYIKSFNPSVEGTEKFMDLQLLMSAGKTDYFPFTDGWRAGETVNYYYYGFYLFALITRLSGVEYATAYNLSLGLILVQTFVLSAAITYRLTKDFIPGIIGAALVTFAGNLHYAYCFVNNFGEEVSNKCFYPKATRILDPAFTINEIPSYSFVLGDLHPHFLSIPLFLVGIYLLIEIFKSEKFNYKLLALFAVVAASAGLINLWDFMTLGFLFGLIIVYKIVSSLKVIRSLNEKLIFVALFFFLILVPAVVLYSYNFSFEIRLILSAWLFALFGVTLSLYSFRFRGNVSLIYIGVILIFSCYFVISSNWIIYIAFVTIMTIAVILRKIYDKYKAKEINFDWKFLAISIITSILTAASPFILFAPFFSSFKSPVTGVGFAPEYVAAYSERFPEMQYPSSLWFLFGIWGIYLILGILSILVIAIFKRYSLNKLFFPLILFFGALFLIAFTELFFMQDLFHVANPPYFRANTVFKFTYHAWILIGIGTAVLLSYAWNSLTRIKNIPLGFVADITYIILTSLIFVSVFFYPFIAFSQAFNPQLPWSLPEGKKLTLDGSAFVKNREPDDYAAIEWLNTNQKERVVVLEAVGSAYTYYARISVNTGMINVINWETHQWTWRFHYPSDIKNWKETVNQPVDTGYPTITKTTGEVRTIYEIDDVELTKFYLQKYNVEYVFVGNLERTTYNNLKEDKFKQLGDVVMESGNSRLYKLTF